MSRPFAAVEGFLERILERPAARLFRARPQPVQLERRIERAMTAHRMVRGGHTYVPSRYRIFLHPSDLAALQEATDQLPNDLADAILSRARAQGFWLVARPEVLLVPSARIAQGELEVDADPLDPSLVSSAAAGLRPVGLEGPRPPRPPIPGTGVVPDPPREAEPAIRVVSAPDELDGSDRPAAPASPEWLPLEASPPPPDDLAPVRPVVAPVVEHLSEPVVEAPRVLAVIEVRAPDGFVRMVDFRGGTVRAGRGTDNEIVILDARGPRHHGRFTARQDVLVYTDQDSTNGSLVNGIRVREVGLGVGDVVRLGRTTLTIRPRP
ncbi:MAG: DUF3662 domain-containing protein [Chloroflexi bacterium]|nr:DUF3662 domain-containing protein [Chloroflexota bacterium]